MFSIRIILETGKWINYHMNSHLVLFGQIGLRKSTFRHFHFGSSGPEEGRRGLKLKLPDNKTSRPVPNSHRMRFCGVLLQDLHWTLVLLLLGLDEGARAPLLTARSLGFTKP